MWHHRSIHKGHLKHAFIQACAAVPPPSLPPPSLPLHLSPAACAAVPTHCAMALKTPPPSSARPASSSGRHHRITSPGGRHHLLDGRAAEPEQAGVVAPQLEERLGRRRRCRARRRRRRGRRGSGSCSSDAFEAERLARGATRVTSLSFPVVVTFPGGVTGDTPYALLTRHAPLIDRSSHPLTSRNSSAAGWRATSRANRAFASRTRRTCVRRGGGGAVAIEPCQPRMSRKI